MAHNLTDNFTLEELTATDTGLDNSVSRNSVTFLRILTMARLLQNVRNRVGFPIIVNSCFRSQLVNRAVGGSRTSFHLIGAAADIRTWHLSDLQKSDLEDALRDYSPREFIKYDTFWHVAFDFSRLATDDGHLSTLDQEFPGFCGETRVTGDL